jgi:hypothetical protein
LIIDIGQSIYYNRKMCCAQGRVPAVKCLLRTCPRRYDTYFGSVCIFMFVCFDCFRCFFCRYANAVEDFATRKGSKVRCVLIRQFCQRFPELAVRMLPAIATAAGSAINDFRRCQTLDLAQAILQQRKNQVRWCGWALMDGLE